jgi:post-segregation antitoxin (ccd killing protein)
MEGKHMPKTSIYLPDDLARQVRDYGISISEVAQEALWVTVETSAGRFREDLAELVERQAGWRALVAEDYPDDPRNGQAVAALSALATYIRSLPADDPQLVRLARASYRGTAYGLGWEGIGGGNWRYALGRYGFHQPVPEPLDGLDALTDAAEEDRAASAE